MRSALLLRTCTYTRMHSRWPTDSEMSNASAPQLPRSRCMSVFVCVWVNGNRILNRMYFLLTRSLFLCLFSLQWQQRADRVPFRFRFLFTTNTSTLVCDSRRCMHTLTHTCISTRIKLIQFLCAPHICMHIQAHSTHATITMQTQLVNNICSSGSWERKQKIQSRMHSFRYEYSCVICAVRTIIDFYWFRYALASVYLFCRLFSRV